MECGVSNYYHGIVLGCKATMRVFTFVVITLCMTLMGYWLGSPPIINWMGSNSNIGMNGTALSATSTTGNTTTSLNIVTPTTWENKPLAVFDTIFFWMLVLGAGLGIVVYFVQGLSFAAFYIFPAIILYAVFNYVIFPFSSLLNVSTPPEIAIPVILIYNVMLTMAIYSAIRGSS